MTSADNFAPEAAARTNFNWRSILAALGHLSAQDDARGQAANDDVPAEVMPWGKHHFSSDGALFATLDAEWASASIIRKRLAKVGFVAADGPIRTHMRRMAKSNPERVESAGSPERWRRKVDFGGIGHVAPSGPSGQKSPVFALAETKAANDNPAKIVGEAAAKYAVPASVKPRAPSVVIGDCATIQQGDCLDVMGSMPAGSVDLIVTSPPYNRGIERGRKRGKKTNTNWKSSFIGQGYASYDDAREPGEYVEWQRACLLEAWRVLADDGAIFYNHSPRIQDKILHTPLDLNPGLPLRQIIIWDRGSGHNHNGHFFTPSCEWIMILAKPRFKLNGIKPRTRDVWKIAPARGAPQPATFPVELPLTAIRNTTAGIVLDPFAGSGSTGVAALRCGRKFIGIELNAGYAETATSRLKAEVEREGEAS